MITEMWTLLRRYTDDRQYACSHVIYSDRKDAEHHANNLNRYSIGYHGEVTLWIAMPYTEACEWLACDYWRQEAKAVNGKVINLMHALGSTRDQLRDAGRGHLVRN